MTSCDYSVGQHPTVDTSTTIPNKDYVNLHHKICTIEDFDQIESDTAYEELLDDCLNSSTKRLNLYAF